MHSDLSKTLPNGVGSNDQVSVPGASLSPGHPDPEVTITGRRRLTAAHKLAILKEADRCTQPGQLGALLRREGLYSSALTNFRKQRDAGRLSVDPSKVRIQRLTKEAARQRDARKIVHLESEITKLNVLLELQKKVSELMQLAHQTQGDY